MRHDAVIVDGSFAGLSVAIYVARTRRTARPGLRPTA